MRLQLIRPCLGFVALLAGALPHAVAMDALPPSTANAMAQAASPQAIAEYRRKLKEYQAARAAFEEEAGAYWASISEKRRGRNAKRRERQTIALDDYVLTQPPVYTGPKRPVDPAPEPAEESRRANARPFPSLPTCCRRPLSNSSSRRNGRRPRSNSSAPMPAIALASGLTREQAVRVYSFETGGNGNHDMQSGLSSRPGSRAISTAIGYNQLLTTNSVELMAEQGHELIKELTAKAAA